MKKILTILVTSLLIIYLAGCGSSKNLSSTDAGDVPDWYLETPTEDDYLFAPTTATSKDMQVAVDKATTDARAEIGRQVEVRLQGLQKSFAEEVGVGDDQRLLQQFTAASKTVVSTKLSGTVPAEKSISKDGDNWRAYVLVKYPIGAAQEDFLQQIKKNDELYTRYRSSEAFKELESEVEKYEEWKKNQ